MENEVFMRFKGGLEKALTFSYDDGVKADIRLMKLFDDNDLRCTFNLNTGVFGNNAHGRMNKEDTLKFFKGCNHEIASHGAKHLFLTKVDTMRGIDEVIRDKRELESLFDTVITGFAYPYGAFNDDIKNYLSLMNIKYARTTISTHNFQIPEDFLQLNPTCHHTDSDLFELADRFMTTYPHDFIKEREPYLFYVWGHSYEFDENNNWELIEEFVKKVSGSKEVWYATNGEIYWYTQAFKSLQFSVDVTKVYNPSGIDVWFEKEGKIYLAPAGKTVHCD